MKKTSLLISLLFFCLITSITHAKTSSPKEMRGKLDSLLDIAYRDDGACSLDWRYTLFSDGGTVFTSPGLNCSGFVLAAARALLDKDISIADAQIDRRGDSGPDSEFGEDWDFGWDLLLNISEGFERSYLNPDGSKSDPAKLNGFQAQGYDLHKKGELDKILSRLQTNKVYLLSFNRKTKVKGYQLLHYHVGIVILDENGDALMYQTTTQSQRSYKRNISKPEERKAFMKAFANKSGNRKQIAIIELTL